MQGDSALAAVLENVSLNKFAIERMRGYGTFVIENRALPDYRDGMKPVHRRILYDMHHELGLRATGHRVKSARMVGDTMGKFHPHGDLAIYETGVGMVNCPVPLIDGQGNFGAFNGKPAAMRYCVTGDTKVMTEYGQVPIKQLMHTQSQAISIQSLDGKWQNATNWLYSGRHRTWQLQTNVGFELTATSNEPVLTVTPGWDLHYKDIGDIKPGDYVCINSAPQERKSIAIDGGTGLTRLLGYLVSDGYCRKYEINFSSAYRSVADDFELLLKSLDFNYSRELRDPNSYGKRKYWDFRSTDHKLRALVANFGIAGNSYAQHIPQQIWQATKPEIISFLSGYFEGDGSVYVGPKNTVQIVAHSVSRRLLHDIKLLLWSEFDILTGPIVPDKADGGLRMFVSGQDSIGKFLATIPFISSRKLLSVEAARAALADIMPTAGNSKLDILPYATNYGVHITRTKAFEHLASYNMSKEIKDKLIKLLHANYLFAKVIAIKRDRKRKVYDLTVPTTHAYTANGFVIHNTEMRLTKYAETFLQPDYMAITPRIPNYDGEEHEPIFLPALLPNLLLNGVSGIAVGVAVNIPPFAAKGVMELIKRAVRGETITAKRCQQHLRIRYPAPFNSVVLTSDADLLEFYRTGKGRLTLGVNYTTTDAIMTIDQFPPYFVMDMAKQNLLIKIPEVASAEDLSDKKHGKILQIRLKPSVAAMDRGEIFEKCLKLLHNYINLSISYIERIDAERVAFTYCTMPELIHRWVAWRIDLEKQVNRHLRDKAQNEIKRLQLLTYAIDNLDKLFIEMKRKAPDLDARVAKALAITLDETKIILTMTARQLSALSRIELLEQIKSRKRMVKQFRQYITNPAKKVLLDLPELIKQVP